MRPRHSCIPSVLCWRFNWSLSLRNLGEDTARDCTRRIHHLVRYSNSAVVSGPVALGCPWRQFRMNLVTQVQTRRVLRRSCRPNSSSKSSVSVSTVVAASTSWMTLASALDSGVTLVTRIGGHASRCCNHSGPFHQSEEYWTGPPRLPRSAGFWSVGTCLHSSIRDELTIFTSAANPM